MADAAVAVAKLPSSDSNLFGPNCSQLKEPISLPSMEFTRCLAWIEMLGPRSSLADPSAPIIEPMLPVPPARSKAHCLSDCTEITRLLHTVRFMSDWIEHI